MVFRSYSRTNCHSSVVSRNQLYNGLKLNMYRILSTQLADTTLERTVKCASGYEDWEANYLPESLDKLGEWFAHQVEKRKRTDEEMKEIYAKFPDRFKGVKINDWELTNRTFSIAIDIGMYLSQIFLKNIPTLLWQHTTKGSKRWIDYGQPVLAGFGKDVFNPTRMMITLAYGIASEDWSGNRLRHIYEIWKKMASTHDK